MNFRDALEKYKGLEKTTADLLIEFGIYPASLNSIKGTLFFMAKEGITKKLILSGNNSFFDDFEGEIETLDQQKIKVCPLSHVNISSIRNLFPYTIPTCNTKKLISIGLGDILGMATPGHIRAVKNRNLFPIFAQQSIEELTTSGRSFDDILDDVSWAVYQEGFISGYGADANELKTLDEVQYALESGFKMISLDLSDYIIQNIENLDNEILEELYSKIYTQKRQSYEKYYIGDMNLYGHKLRFSYKTVRNLIIKYEKALLFVKEVHRRFIHNKKTIDLEIILDKNNDLTTLESHYFFSNELLKLGVKFHYLAICFVNDFYSGIDYKDNQKFIDSLISHKSISDFSGYKLSIHSGSDKYNLYDLISKNTNNNFHLKTSGSSWLEAMKLISYEKPILFRDILNYCIQNFYFIPKNSNYNIVLEDIPDIKLIENNMLNTLLENDNIRQLLHLSYGLLINAYNENQKEYLFKNEIFYILFDNEELYTKLIESHTAKHLDLLNIAKV